MVSRGLAKSREQANSMLMAGTVFVNQKRIDKPGQQITKESEIDVKGKIHPWVSRGGIKLEKAILEYNLDCNYIFYYQKNILSFCCILYFNSYFIYTSLYFFPLA